jgi:hypothetical protein
MSKTLNELVIAQGGLRVPGGSPAVNLPLISADSSGNVTWGTLKTIRRPHTFGIRGTIATSSGVADLSNYIPPFFISLGSSETAKIVKCRYVLGTGTSATCKLQKNGVDVTGFTAISATTTAATTTATGVSVAEDDQIALVVTAVSGAPGNLSFTVFIEHVVT